MIKKLIFTSIIVSLSTHSIYLYLSDNLNKYINERYALLSLAMSLISLSIGITWSYKIYLERFKLINELEKAKDSRLFISGFLLIIFSGYFKLYFISALILALLILKTDILEYTRKNISLVLLILIITLALIIPPKALTKITVQNRLGDLNSIGADISFSNQEKAFNFGTDKYTMKDWAIEFNRNPNLDDYVGKKVNVTGFVFKPDYLDSNQFLISRFVVRCCAVDAVPTGIIVVNNSQEEFKDDDWLEIKGIFEITETNNQKEIAIKPDSIKKISEPANPYL